MVLKIASEIFESGCELLDVTSISRPDPSWSYSDQQGHEHRWYVGDRPAENYNPVNKYEVPTLEWVHDEWRYDEDGERYEIGHLACKRCHETVKPRKIPDQTTQYVPGLRWFTINGEPVSPEEFERRMKLARSEKLEQQS